MPSNINGQFKYDRVINKYFKLKLLELDVFEDLIKIVHPTE